MKKDEKEKFEQVVSLIDVWTYLILHRKEYRLTFEQIEKIDRELQRRARLG